MFSKVSATLLKVRRLLQSRSALADAVRDPSDDLRCTHARRAKELIGLARIAQQGIARVSPFKTNRLAEFLAKLFGDTSHAEQFGTGNVDHVGRRGSTTERLEAHRARVGLPNGV